jgi:NAD(P)-dependent dehydrogenase (short-subunit alcohol dehydrogenase family)
METVLVTGAGRGIGLELTRRFLEAGRHVIATARDPHRSAELNSLASPSLTVAALDVTDAGSTSRLSSDLSGRPIDVLVSNAGVMGSDRQGVHDMDYSAWLHTFEVNTLAPFRVTIGFLENLRLAERPRVVALSSQMGALDRKSVGWFAYRSSKAALNKVMQVLASELKPDGIVVCPVHPGWVRTDMGGPEADISVEESVRGLVALIDSLTLEQSGRFWTWEGGEHPW